MRAAGVVAFWLGGLKPASGAFFVPAPLPLAGVDWEQQYREWEAGNDPAGLLQQRMQMLERTLLGEHARLNERVEMLRATAANMLMRSRCSRARASA